MQDLPKDSIVDHAERRSINNRLRRLEGQVRGLQSMIDAGQECEAVLTQILAARSALGQVGLHIVGYSMKRCLAEGTPADRDGLIDRSFEVYLRYRTLAGDSQPGGLAVPREPEEMLSRLRTLEAELRSVQEALADGTACEELVVRVSEATVLLNEVALGVLGHAMKRCLVEDSKDRDRVIDQAVAVFVRYSPSLR